MSEIERFWLKVNKRGPDECWEWTGGRFKRVNYGFFTFGGKLRSTHRIAYELTHGPILPPRICVCHRCDNPPCCNPAHLFLGTHKDNTQDMIRKGRNRQCKGEDSGNSKLTNAQVAAMRVKYMFSDITQAELSAQFGVSQSVISETLSGKAWRHLDGVVPRRVTMTRTARGEKHHSSKMTASGVIEMRRRYAEGGITMTALSVEYGIGKVAARYIIRRRTWRHI